MNLFFCLLGFTSIVSKNSFFLISDSTRTNNFLGDNFGIDIEKDLYRMTGFFSLKIGVDHCDSTRIGLYDPRMGIGVNTKLLSSYLNIIPIFSFPIYKDIYSPHRFGAGIKIHYINYIFDLNFDILKYFNNLYNINLKTGLILSPKFLGFDIGLKYHSYLYKDIVSNKLYFTPSLIYKGKKSIYISAGLEFRISQAASQNKTLDSLGILTGETASPPWYLTLSASYTPQWNTKKEKQELIYFHLFDKKTGKPISGLISIEGIGSIMTDSTGIGKIKIYPKIYKIAVLKKDYVNIDTICDIKGKKDIFLFLTSSSHKGWVTGMITDRKTGNPLYASITIIKSNKVPFYSDKLTGIYNITLPAGSYVIKIASKGYFIYTDLIDVKEGEREIRNFYLIKKE